MATISSARMNLIEAQKRANLPEKAELLGEMLEANPFMKALPWYPASHTDHHESKFSTRLGKGGFIGLNQGTPVTSSEVDMRSIPLCIYAGMSQVSDRLLRYADNPAEVRSSEDMLDMEGASQDFVTQFFYNTGKDPKAFKGLANLRNKLDNVYTFDAGGGADTNSTGVSSLYLIEFGKLGLNMRYNNKISPGWSDRDKGMSTITREDGTREDIWEREFEIGGAPEIKREDAYLRFANISDSVTFDMDKFLTMKNKLAHHGMGAVGYINEEVQTRIEIMLNNKENLYLTRGEVEGFGPCTMICGIPLFVQDSIVNTESVIS